MMMIRTAIAMLVFALPVSAQVTLEELDEAADKTDAAMTAFRARLNDPDPDRALTVLQMLITRGDSMQRRLAIRHGLSSTDSAMRATTLRAIFDAKPTINAVFAPASQKPSTYYFRNVLDAGGVIDTEGKGSVTFKLNGFNDEHDCWTHSSRNTCLIRVRGENVSLWFGGSWGTYVLDAGTGQLVGKQTITKNLTSATIDLAE